MSNCIAPVTYTYEDGQTVRLLASGAEVRVTVEGLAAEFYPVEAQAKPECLCTGVRALDCLMHAPEVRAMPVARY